jgi:excisionase family DNA binding protein
MKTNNTNEMKTKPNKDDSSPELMKKRGAAAIADISVRTLERAIAAGKLKKHKIGGCVRVSRREILAFYGLSSTTY